MSYRNNIHSYSQYDLVVRTRLAYRTIKCVLVPVRYTRFVPITLQPVQLYKDKRKFTAYNTNT